MTTPDAEALAATLEHVEDDLDTQIARLIGRRFIARHTVKATQSRDGAYRPVTDQHGNDIGFTLEDLVAHVQGRRSFGHYMVSPKDNCTKLVAFDLDVSKKPVTINGHQCESPRDAVMDPYHPDHDELIRQLHYLADGLAYRMREIGEDSDTPVTMALAFSGSKGVHVYGWFGERTHTKRARYLAEMTLLSFKDCFEPEKGLSRWRHRWDYQAIEIEVYPKQDTMKGKDYGNLMRLPLGRNLKSGGRGFFMRPSPHDANDFQFVEMDALEALSRGSL